LEDLFLSPLKTQLQLHFQRSHGEGSGKVITTKSQSVLPTGRPNHNAKFQ